MTEIPEDRWSLDGFFHSDIREAIASGRSYSKWGCFLEGFADFDPLFFRISPLEAVNTDPQERLFLQCAWNALEEAGYTREAVERSCQGRVEGVRRNNEDRVRVIWTWPLEEGRTRLSPDIIWFPGKSRLLFPRPEGTEYAH